uniref:BRD4 interacting chromatin remodeling complex associated protein n=1 Tax=Neogobius melanostomus TaxID=47308 RepID=A0A8C6WG67_9GOBI
MDDEDGRCLLDVICDPEALNDFLHGSETHLDTDDLLDGSMQLSANEPAGLPRVSVDLDFLEDDDILGGSPGGESGGNGIGTNHEPCDILQQSLAEANITEQSLQEAEAELDLGSFGIPGLTQVVQTLPDASLTGAGAGQSSTATPPNAAADMLGSVLAQQGLQLQPHVMNKAISMQPVGLGNVTLQPISSLHTLPNGSQSGLGIGPIQVVGQPTVMTINQSGQPILAKAMGGYQLQQSGPEISGGGSQASIRNSSGLLIQGNKATLGSPALNGPAVCVSSTNSSSSGTVTNVIIQRTPTPIQPKPPQGGPIQPKLFKQQQPQPTSQPHQNDAHKALGLQQLPVSAAQNVAFLTGKPGSNVVLSTPATSQAPQFQQTLFKQQATQPSGKPLSVHLLNQSGSIVLQGQNPQFVQLQAGGQILTQHPGGHIITSHGPGGQLIANQILTTNQNINLGQVLTSQGPSGAVPSTGHQQPLKIQNMCSSPAMAAHPTAQRVSESPQPSQSPFTLSQQMQSPHQQSRPPSQPQPQNQTPSRSCTPSHPPLFIIHNQTSESPQPTAQPQAQIQVQFQPQPTAHPIPHQQEIPSLSQSPKPPTAPVAQHQFSAVSISAAASAVVKAQVPIVDLQLVTSQIQTLSAIAQPSPQQKQLLEKLLEQLRKQQGSVLHPNYSAPFNTFEDTLQRLLPYHLYQGNIHSSNDYDKVDDEFEKVSSMLLKRTQAMVDKYRHLLFSESKRLGPSAEMVMIDRMFIQEEKVALSQDRILAKERPGISEMLINNGIKPITSPAAATSLPPATSASPFPPTKLVIKQGGAGASVSWSTSSSSSHFSSSPFNSKTSDDDDTLLQRTSKPPIKTYEARRRIGLKLKIKQDQTGFSKVVHNTALDPVHTPQPHNASHKQAPSTLSNPSVQMNGTVEHHSGRGVKNNPAATSTSFQTTCRLPLRKTYRENVSPRVRPVYQEEAMRLILEPQTHHPSSNDVDFETGESKYKKMKNRQRAGGTFRMDQHAPDALLPAKRCKSDSPDMDNASFSSGSPPDDSLNEHLQCAIDSILNLQQEPTGHGPHIKGRPHHDHHLPGISTSLSHRPSVLPSVSYTLAV